MAEEDDSETEGGGKVDETTRTARYEGMRADPDREWLSYAEALAYVQQVGGPPFTVEAARSWLLRGVSKEPSKVYLAARFRPSLLIGDDYKKEWEFDWHPKFYNEEFFEERTTEQLESFFYYLPSLEAALGGKARWREQPTGAPWTAENTEWAYSELRAALLNPTTGPVMKAEAAAQYWLDEQVADTGSKEAEESVPAQPPVPMPSRGFHRKDAPLVQEMREHIVARRANGPWAASALVVDKAERSGSEDSARKRLCRVFSQTFSEFRTEKG